MPTHFYLSNFYEFFHKSPVGTVTFFFLLWRLVYLCNVVICSASAVLIIRNDGAKFKKHCQLMICSKVEKHNTAKISCKCSTAEHSQQAEHTCASNMLGKDDWSIMVLCVYVYALIKRWLKYNGYFCDAVCHIENVWLTVYLYLWWKD